MKKTMFKRTISICLAVLLLTAAPLAGFVGLEIAPKAKAIESTGQCGDHVSWTFDNSTGVLIISGIGEMYGVWHYDQSDAAQIKSVIINHGVTRIGGNAFRGCTALESVTIPSSVSSIGSFAFYECKSLTSITLPDGIQTIDEHTFQWSGLTHVSIPNSVKSIRDDAFYGCDKLTSVTLPDSLISIGNSSFNGCKSLSNIIFPNELTSIGTSAFSECYGLTRIQIPDSVTSVGMYAFSHCSSLTKVIIGKGLTEIPKYMFSECRSIESVVLGDNVTIIGDSAFNECVALNELSIPNCVTTIGLDAFWGCSELTNVTIPDNVSEIKPGTFAFCSKLKNVVLSNYLNSIGENAFYFCKSLESVVIPDCVTTIGKGAFEYCTSLSSLTISKGVSKISHSTFANCSSLTNLTIPDGVTIIEASAFSSCRALRRLELPSSLTIIEQFAFGGCNNILDIYYNGTESQWNAISTETNYEWLTTATIHYGSTSISDDPDNPDDPSISTERFDPQSTTGIYQCNGILDNYVTTVVLNDSDIYVESVTISGKKYDVKKDILSEEKAKQLKGKNVIFNYDKKEEKIIAISKCREFSDLDSTDISAINSERRISIKIANEYKWSSGKVRVAGGTTEVTAIPFEILISNSLPSAYFDLTDECKNNSKFDLKISSLQVRGVENCGDVTLYNNSPRTIKLGSFALIRGSIKILSEFWLGYEDVEKKIIAEYGVLLNDVKLEWGAFQTVVKNRDPKQQPQSQQEAYNYNKLLADAANKLKSSSVISLAGLADLGFSLGQRQFLEKLVLVELSLFTMPKESLEEYVSNKVMEKIFGAKKLIDVQNGKMTIVVPYQNRTKQLDIVCDIQEYSLTNRTFGNFTTLTYHAYDVKNGKREKKAFKDGTAGLAVSVNAKAFAEAATDFALAEIKSATKTVLEGYEEVERIIFGDAALKILKAAGYNSNFDFGWDLYVNECKKLAFECPVDVYVYDEHDNLCGAIVNNAVTLDTSELVDLEVKNDEKIVMLWEDGYYVKTLANCEGTLDISVKEMGYINGAIRTLTFKSLPLSAGTLYRQSYGTDYYDDQSAYAVEELNGDRIEATSDTLNQQFELTASDHTHTYTSTVITEPTCTADGEATYTCTVCGDTYTEPIPATGNHVDEDNDGLCDDCNKQMKGDGRCKYCGQIHKGFGGFFTKIIHFFLGLFGRTAHEVVS